MEVRALKDHILVEDMNFDERITSGGIIIMGDDARMEGIRARWAKVYAIGPKQEDIKVGDWILTDHGRWTRGFKMDDDNGEEKTIRRVDNKDVLLVSDELPDDKTIARGL